MDNQKILKYIQYSGLALLVFILARLDHSNVYLYLRKSNYIYLLIGYPFLILLVYIKGFRWNLMMRKQNVRLSYMKTFYIYLWAFYFGVITPGRVGEVSKAFYVKNEFKSFGDAFISVFLDRIVDVVTILIIVMFFIPIYGHDIINYNIYNYFIWFVLSVGFIFCLYKISYKKIINLLKRAFYYFTPTKYKNIAKQNVTDFTNYLTIFIRDNRLILISLVLSIFAFICQSTFSYMILKSLSINMSFSYNMFCLGISSLVALIPISISGLGYRELVMIYLFGNIGLPKEAAVIFSLSLFFISIVLGLHGYLINLLMVIFKKNNLNKI